jgi:hypothetical protein
MGTDISGLVTVLERKGIEVLQPRNAIAVGASFPDVIRRLIREADLFIVVFDKAPTQNPNLYFELGMASAYGKRAMIVAPPLPDQLPAELSRYLVVRGGLENTAAFSFALDQLLAAPRPKKPTDDASRSTLKPIGDLAITLLDQLRDLDREGGREREVALEEIVAAALQASGIAVIVPSNDPLHPQTELAAWGNELRPLGANPLLIDVKYRLSSDSLKQVVSTQHVLMDRAGTSYALVLYVYGDTGIKALRDLPGSILLLRIEDLLARLRTERFDEVLASEIEARLYQQRIS